MNPEHCVVIAGSLLINFQSLSRTAPLQDWGWRVRGVGAGGSINEVTGTTDRQAAIMEATRPAEFR